MSNTRLTDEWGSFSAIPNEFVDNAADLSDQARWLFVLLRRYTNQQTGTAFPSYELIQKQTGWTPKTIAKAVRELEAAGWLERHKAPGAVTNYVLRRKNCFPQGSEVLPVGKWGTSRREVVVLPVGKCIKKNTRSNKKTETRSDLRSGSKNPHYDRFASAYQARLQYPYGSRKADFVRFADWKKLDNDRTSWEDFEKAIEHYFATPQGQYTFADLLSRFAIFRLTPLDKYGKPVESEQAPTPVSVAPLPLGCEKCQQGYIMPTTPGGMARRCECSQRRVTA